MQVVHPIRRGDLHAGRVLKYIQNDDFPLIVSELSIFGQKVSRTGMVFAGIFVAWAGGFWLVWLYGQPWFLDFDVFGTNMQALFQIHPINLSVAIWVGFLALFGIASDDGVVIATYLDQSFFRRKITTSTEAREATLAAGQRRVRPCLMTTATTILALIPVLTSTGRGADIRLTERWPTTDRSRSRCSRRAA